MIAGSFLQKPHSQQYNTLFFKIQGVQIIVPATWQPHLLTCYTDSENQSDRMEHTEGEMGKL